MKTAEQYIIDNMSMDINIEILEEIHKKCDKEIFDVIDEYNFTEKLVEHSEIWENVSVDILMRIESEIKTELKNKI